MALHRDPRLLQLLHQGLVICLEQVRVNGSGNDLVVPPQELLRLLRRQNLQQSFYQPQRVTVSDGQIFRRTAAAYLRHIHPVCHKFPQHSVDHAGRPGPSVPPAHLHRLIYGGTMGDLVHEQDLIPADAQDIADHRLQLMGLLHTVAGDIVVQQCSILDHAIGKSCGQGSLPALQPIFGNGALEAAVGPGIGPLHLHQYLQRRVPGGHFSILTHFPVSMGWPRR